MLAWAERFAAAATPARLAMTLAAVVVALLVNAAANAPVEQALRARECGLFDCLRPLRPETRHGGYTAAEFRAFLDAIGALRGRALAALLTDLPVIAALVAALLTATGLAARGLPISERPRRILVGLPLGFAVADLAEDALLATAYAGLADTAVLLPWVSALKFGLLVASTLLSLLLGFMRFALN
jgi:hypothetical protein